MNFSPKSYLKQNKDVFQMFILCQIAEIQFHTISNKRFMVYTLWWKSPMCKAFCLAFESNGHVVYHMTSPWGGDIT